MGSRVGIWWDGNGGGYRPVWRFVKGLRERRPGGRWIAFIEELPGVNTQGETLDEARENLREALWLIVETNRELAREQSEGREVIREPFALAR